MAQENNPRTSGTEGRNIDPSEIRKFDSLAERWWDPESEFKTLHQINPLRLDYIDRMIGLKGKRVLDVGCGGGILAEAMEERGAEVVAIDAAKAPLAVGKLHAEKSGAKVDYRLITAEELAVREPGGYDAVTCLEMLEHVPDPAAVVQACATLVRPGGQAFFATINRTPKAFLFAIVGGEYILRLLPRGTHQYEKLIKPSELESWSRAAGLEIKDLIGLHYNPILRYYWLAPGVQVNYMMATMREGEA